MITLPAQILTISSIDTFWDRSEHISTLKAALEKIPKRLFAVPKYFIMASIVFLERSVQRGPPRKLLSILVWLDQCWSLYTPIYRYFLAEG